MVQAWQIANFDAAAHAGKLPNLSELLVRRDRQRMRRTPIAQRAQLALVAEHIGSVMRPISDAAKRALLKLRHPSGE